MGSLYHSERLRRERDFHNERFAAGDNRESQTKFYWAIERGANEYGRIVLSQAIGKDVLSYGCSNGSISQQLSVISKSIVGIDISDVAIAQAKASNRASNVSFHVMDATDLTFPEGSFDLVFGSGIVHHLDTRRSSQEVSRVLRAGGKAVFWEPMGNNPIINFYRRATPNARTVDEHPLLDYDLTIMRESFRSVEATYFGFTTLAALPLRATVIGKPLRGALEAIDAMIFAVPSLHRLAWFSHIVCTK